MTLTSRRDNKFAEDAEDLRQWLEQLPTPQPVTETIVLGCPQHGETSPTWAYVEADAKTGIARRRCLSCGHSVALLDSDEHWTFPSMWSCLGCGHSIAEVAVGMNVSEDERVSWLLLGARCVECGRLGGLTDIVVPGLPKAEVVAGL